MTLMHQLGARGHHQRKVVRRYDATYTMRMQAAADAELVSWLLSEDCEMWLHTRTAPFWIIDRAVGRG